MPERRFWRPRRRRSRAAGCLIWLVILIIVLVILSVLFGGFQKGKKAGMASLRPGMQHPVTLQLAAAPGHDSPGRASSS
jgi:heme A synthase